MKTSFFSVCLLTLLSSYTFGQGYDYANNELIFQVGEFTLDNQIHQLQQELEAIQVNFYPMFNMRHWQVPDTMYVNDGNDTLIGVEEAIEYCSQHSFVELVEPNNYFFIDAIPNDSEFNKLWGLHNGGQSNGKVDADIDAPEAWDIQTQNNEDESIIVGVLDTGVDWNHEDLKANMWKNPQEIPDDGFDNDNNGYIDDYYGYDFVNGDNNPMDTHGHGTHIAGTIAATTDNMIGISGVTNNKAKIMALQIFDAAGTTSLNVVLEAIHYSILMKVPITNNSWGGSGQSRLLKEAIENASENKQLFIAAAGNDHINNDVSPHYPASYDLPNIISVAASTRNDEMAFFSNYGQNTVDLVAPGHNIYSTMPGNTFGYQSGTSMAAPHVAGAAAMIWASYPTLTYQEVKEKILSSVDLIPNFSNQTATSGRLNLNTAIQGCMLPGDANNDQKVDMLDLLAVGFSQNETGFSRNNQNTDFTPKASKNWPTTFDDELFSGINHKHADSNGDGIVKKEDMEAVGNNYNSHLYIPQISSSVNGAKVMMRHLNTTTNPTNGCKTTRTEIFLRKENTNIELHGIAFSINYDKNNIATTKNIDVQFQNGCLGAENIDFLGIAKDFSATSTVDIGITRVSRNTAACTSQLDIPLVIFVHTVVSQDVPAFIDNSIAIARTGDRIIVESSSSSTCERIYVNHAASTGANNGESWTDAFVSLQTALDSVARCPDLKEIWVAQGTYTPSKIVDTDEDGNFDNREKTFQLIDGVKIYGGFKGNETDLSQRDYGANVTTLSGNIDDLSSSDDNAFHVVYNTGVSTATLLDGFTVRDGYNLQRSGGGLFNTGRIKVNNCTFLENTAENGGGLATNNYAEINNCSFMANHSSRGGGILNIGEFFIVKNCHFENNVAFIGGGLCDFKQPTKTGGVLLNCTFKNNRVVEDGGGVYIETTFDVINNCLFIRNKADRYGGGMCYSAIFSFFGGDKVNNCTFSENEAVKLGGGIYYSTPPRNYQLSNCIFWSNRANNQVSSFEFDDGGQGQDYNESWVSPMDISFTLLEEQACNSNTQLICGPGNILGVNPLFVDPSIDDFRLQANSLAVNTGNNSYIPEDICDLDNDGNTLESIPYDFQGSIRIQQEQVDMGVFEQANGSNFGNILYVDQNATGAETGVDWTNAFKDLQDALNTADSSSNITEIWVAQGTYYPSKIVDVDGNGSFEAREATFKLVNGVKIYGGFCGIEEALEERDYKINITTLSGNIGDISRSDDNAFHVIYNQNFVDTALLDGFTITQGQTLGNSLQGGAGIYNQNSNFSIANCTFKDNTSFANGGAILHTGNNNNVVLSITNCTFVHNKAGSGAGIHYSNGGHLLLKDCSFFNNTVDFYGGAINSHSPNANLRMIACTFENNKADTHGGALSTPSNDFIVINCTFTNNEASNFGGGIFYSPGNNTLPSNITNCVFNNNSSGVGGSIYFSSSPDTCYITNSTFSNNSSNNTSANHIYNDANLFIQNSIFHSQPVSSTQGIYNGTRTMEIYSSLLEGNSCPSNVICDATTIFGQDPLFIDAVNGDFYLQSTSPAINAGNNTYLPLDTYDLNENGNRTEPLPYDLDGNKRVQESKVNMGAFENSSCDQERIYVNHAATGSETGLDWTNAFTDLQSALDTAKSCSNYTEIWVAKGVYTPSKLVDFNNNGNLLAREATFELVDGVKLYGGFSGNGLETNLSERDYESNITTLSGNIGDPSNSDDNAFHVVYTHGLNNKSLLDGFTITDGHSFFNGDNVSNGSGMLNRQNSEIKIANCKFIANKAVLAGGVANENSNPIFTNCYFRDNTGVMLNRGSNPLLIDCHFFNNLSDNHSYVLSNSYQSKPTIIGCTFSNNKGRGCLYNEGRSLSKMVNCSFINNDASAIFNMNLTTLTLINCNFISNKGSGIENNPETSGNITCNIQNCIFWDNEEGSIKDSKQNVFNISNSLLQESTCPSFNGNVNCDAGTIFGQDPLFVNASNGDFQLQGNSPAINAGNNAYLLPDTYDLDNDGDTTEPIPYDLEGNDRIQGTIVDMGAYEREACGQERIYVNHVAAGNNTGTDWTNAFKDLQSALEQAENCNDFKEIWVAQGVYKPSKSVDFNNNGTPDVREVTFELVNGVKIYGGFNGQENNLNQRDYEVNITTLSGNINDENDNEDNAFHVVYTHGLSSTSLIDGFTVTNGYAYANNNGYTGKGGGMLNQQNSSINITNCKFTANKSLAGAGVANENSNPTFSNCSFSENEGSIVGGGMLNDNSNPLIKNCLFTNNFQSGFGSALSNTNQSKPTIVSCKFVNNEGDGCLYNESRSSPKIINCNFVNNKGFAICSVILSSPTLINCNFISNQGVGIKNSENSGAICDVQNCIFWDNLDGSIEDNNGSMFNISHSLLQESTQPSSSNVTFDTNTIFGQDPLFVNASNGEFQLQNNSPAINTGNNTYLLPDTYDLDNDGDITEPIPYDLEGNDRIQGTIVDMGAYESTVEFTAITGKFKTFLSGPYNSSANLMNVELYNNQLLPLEQPFNQSPWNYNGTESVASFNDIPNNTVDWILAEIRDENQTVVEQKAGFLLNDGSIVATDLSINGLAFENLTVGNQYYVVIRHRNHLPVMSANLLTVSNNGSLAYDFTSGTTQAWKNSSLPNEPMKVEGNISLLWAGNANLNTNIKYNGSQNDKNTILAKVGLNTPSNIIQGYENTDLNLDGLVKYNGSNNDKNVILKTVGLATPSNIIVQHLP